MDRDREARYRELARRQGFRLARRPDGRYVIHGLYEATLAAIVGEPVRVPPIPYVVTAEELPAYLPLEPSG